tara:strand:+ start:1374 stop:1592 length:219 start_codon:yes stop_codon:yes gene_type:complete
MFNIGDLVTADSEALRLHLHENTYKQWETNKLGIVVAVEGYKGGATVLVKVHFESLGNSYWLYSREVILITP